MRWEAIAIAVGLGVSSCGDDGNAGPRSTQLAFIVQPSPTISDRIITPPVQVAIEDASGTVLGTAGDAITLRLLGPGPPTGPNLSGTLTVNAVAGIAIFSDLRVSVPGNGYILHAGADGFVEVPSVLFDIAPHPSGLPPSASNSARESHRPNIVTVSPSLR
jgi:hypothetical protein